MTEQHVRLIGAECSTYGEPERPDYYQWFGWTTVAVGFIYYAWRFVS